MQASDALCDHVVLVIYSKELSLNLPHQLQIDFLQHLASATTPLVSY